MAKAIAVVMNAADNTATAVQALEPDVDVVLEASVARRLRSM